jgi:putative phosphoribosyl transferase
MRFRDRVDAGRQLADLIRDRGLTDPSTVVLGLPRGGVPVAYEVAVALDLPLDVIVIRKLGVPGQPELAMGAIGEGGTRTINHAVLAMAGVTLRELAAVERRERSDLEQRVHRFRGNRAAVPLTGKTVLIVDDGIATGSTARAACLVARSKGASKVLLAAPVAPPHTIEELRDDADDIICVHSTDTFWAIGQFYDDFSQVTDDEVSILLEKAERPSSATRRPSERDPYLESAREEAEGTELQEDPYGGSSLEVEREEAQGVEVFADPDATLQRSILREGSPGHETLTGDSVGLARNGEEDRVPEETHHR